MKTFYQFITRGMVGGSGDGNCANDWRKWLKVALQNCLPWLVVTLPGNTELDTQVARKVATML